jgi:hypothetical protein
MTSDELPMVFVTHAADTLGDTERGLSGAQIVRLTSAYAVDAGVRIPHDAYPFEKQGINKRSALAQNIAAFPGAWRYTIIRELCDNPTIQERNGAAANNLKARLFTQYGHLNAQSSASDLNHALVEETKHWLSAFPKPLGLYEQADQKLLHGMFDRNVLDDLRLALETLFHEVLGSQKSLENQLPALGAFIKARGGSPDLANMFVKLIDYYAKYQNTYVKHDSAVIEQEVQFVFEISSCFMRHLVRIYGRTAG